MGIVQRYGEQATPFIPEKQLCLKEELKEFYDLPIERVDLLRNVGGAVFAVIGAAGRYILKLYEEDGMHTAQKAFWAARVLEEKGVDTIQVMDAKNAELCVFSTGEAGYLYKYIEGAPAGDAQMPALGAYVANVQKALGGFTRGLQDCGKEYYIDRLTRLMYECGFDAGMVRELEACGKQLWQRLSHLKRGVIHGDLNRTNVLVDAEGRLFLIDMDSVCNSFLMYDAAVICETFRHKPFTKEQMEVSTRNFAGFCAAYPMRMDMQAFFDLLTMRRFELNATALEKIKDLKIPAVSTLIRKEANNLLEWQEHGSAFCRV